MRKQKTVKKKPKKLHKDEIDLQNSIKHRNYIIKRRSKFREYWDYIVMTLAIYNCIWTPLTVSFEWAIIQDDKPVFKVVEWIILIIYTVDIII